MTGTALVLGGKTGLLGQSLAEILNRAGWTTICPGREDLDIFDSRQIENLIRQQNVTHVFNTVAYTQVDKAEDEPEMAGRLNRTLPVRLGQICKAAGTSLVHYSTDFVFNGKKETPYEPEDPTDPLSVYGRTKLEGETGLLELGLDDLLILRTAWLFGPCKTNFIERILTLAKDREELTVIHDQIGCPTYTPDLARHTLELINKNASGTFHLTNSGQASWCEFAAEAVSCAGLPCRVQPITSEEYPQKAVRPRFSVLDTTDFTRVTGTTPRPWVQALREYLFQTPSFC